MRINCFKKCQRSEISQRNILMYQTLLLSCVVFFPLILCALKSDKIFFSSFMITNGLSVLKMGKHH